MLFIKSLLLLLSLIFAVSNATGYVGFKVDGPGCNATKIITLENGACQTVCTNLYGKVTPTNDPSKFNLNPFIDVDCKTPLMAEQQVTCLPDNKPFKVSTLTVTCIPDTTSSSTSPSSTSPSSTSPASTLIGSIAFVTLAALFALI
ncbi:hypothetical protein DDB_G0286247 [Dictyostelium discoideum AX4]|uniref:Ponticulin-like protein B n=1 Tax=Dictyostelium discoideum TaxID=44689 RepID=PONB_DICDI|nr:hypothetical protein DDB_G0286247 [Dictyostelium discoideum AX4]Q54M25.1 RecName: Full=Ponticulin-like protein B; Flags: Precursor [Dictyostelium discoideum]EAL64299.1 hypothetical protein DDB_G0286247 [Dictyostelium discoideum AX4]|eukprot:XP_637806.1 hypothetical protein DDB_G0286247 [Dictyostelium discoideum AX4]